MGLPNAGVVPTVVACEGCWVAMSKNIYTRDLPEGGLYTSRAPKDIHNHFSPAFRKFNKNNKILIMIIIETAVTLTCIIFPMGQELFETLSVYQFTQSSLQTY